MASATDAPRVGVGGFYEALWAGTREAVTRWHLDLALEGALIAAWFLIRTVASVDSRAYLLWVVAVGLVAIVTPRSGLVVFVATSVFYEPDSLVPSIAPRELIVLPLALGVIIQVVADRFRWRPGPAIWLALVLLRRDGSRGRPHVSRVRPGLPVARRAGVDREHAGADRCPRRRGVDGP